MKTPEDFIIKSDHIYHDNDTVTIEMVELIKLMKEYARQEREWISVEERLPETLEYVLVYNTERAILVGRRYTNGWTALFSDGETNMGKLAPTHWMPLPDAPLTTPFPS